MSSLLDPLAQRARARTNFGALAGALELLESPVTLTRSSGVYALESLAREDASARESVVEIVSALVRRRAGRVDGAGGARSPNGASPNGASPNGASPNGASPTSVAGDVQAALAVLGRIARSEQGAPLDLHGISLREAFLPGARFAGALLYGCDLEGTLLDGADLRGAWLWRTNLKRVNLDNADLRGADLSGARGLKREQLQLAIRDRETRLPPLDVEINQKWAPR